jgi:hypothetical protein
MQAMKYASSQIAKAMAMEHVYSYQSTLQEKKPVPADDPCDDWSETPIPKRKDK